MSEKFLLSSVLLLYIAKHVKPSKDQVVNASVIRCYAVSSITLPLVEGFLENRSIRATSPLLCLWILIIALQHRTKRYLHSKESAKRPQILPVFRSARQLFKEGISVRHVVNVRCPPSGSEVWDHVIKTRIILSAILLLALVLAAAEKTPLCLKFASAKSLEGT